MIIELRNVKENDFVYCTGDSGFCDPSVEKVKKVTTQYDESDGKPYNVIWLSGDRKFDARNGYAMNPPTAYYLIPTEQQSAKTLQDNIDKEQTEREIRDTKIEANKKLILDKLTIEERKILGF